MIKEINPIATGTKTTCLLVGNGINRLFEGASWENLITNEIKESERPFTYEEIKNMPATMQIVAATNDSVNSRMKDLSDTLMQINMTDDRASFLQSLLHVPTDDILTANYSFELEAASGMNLNKKQYSARLRSTFDLQSKHKHFRVFQYYETESGKRIWHIHGDAAKPETMMMGHYYYSKQLRDIQDCIAKSIRRYKICERNGESFQQFSWIDRFLVSDVYILGLGMYLCEADLWYLLCCKKRNFPETKVYFYDKDCKDKEINIMLSTYGVELINGKDLKKGTKKRSNENEYKAFYSAAIDDISKRMFSSERNKDR